MEAYSPAKPHLSVAILSRLVNAIAAATRRAQTSLVKANRKGTCAPIFKAADAPVAEIAITIVHIQEGGLVSNRRAQLPDEKNPNSSMNSASSNETEVLAAPKAAASSDYESVTGCQAMESAGGAEANVCCLSVDRINQLIEDRLACIRVVLLLEMQECLGLASTKPTFEQK